MPHVDPLHHGDARILAQAPGQLTVADVDRDHPGGAPLEQDVGEAARRRPDIEGGPAGGIDLERVEGRRQLLPATAVSGSPVGTPATRTRPARTIAWARSREATSPRSTSAWSRRRRSATIIARAQTRSRSRAPRPQL